MSNCSDLVSIIIPCFNNEEYVKDAIQSALHQTYTNFEVIVINDGSTDNSLQNIKAFKDKIRIINQPNMGGCAARNAGISKSKGKWIKFLDADDILVEDCVEHQISKVKNENEIVFGDLLLIDEEKQILTHPKHSETSKLKSGDTASLEMFLNSWVLISTTLYPANVLKRFSGFNENVKRGQEHELHLRLYLNGVDFIYHPLICFYYRQHQSPSRLSVGRRKESHFDDINNFRWLVQLVETGPRSHESKKNLESLANIAWRIGRKQVRFGDIQRARYFFAEAKRISPRNAVYGSMGYRIVYSLLGPVLTEKIGTILCHIRGKRPEKV